MGLDRLSKAAEIGREEGLDSLLLNLATVCDIGPLRDYYVYNRFGFDPIPTLDDLHFVWIDPTMIEYDFRSMPLPLRGRNAVAGTGSGHWDRSTIEFDEKSVYRSIRARFVDGVEWEDTEQYRRAMRNIRRGVPAWNECQTRSDVDRRCARLDALYRRMSTEGFKTQYELYSAEDDPEREAYVRRIGRLTVPDEIRVAVGRQGAFIRIAHGRHRISIARILGIEWIPAIVQVTHADWDGRLADMEGVRTDTKWEQNELLEGL